MASSETPPPSLRQGVRIVPPESSMSVEEVLLAVGEQVGHEKLCFASRMNKAVVVFLKEEAWVHQLIESGVVINDAWVQVSPLAAPSTRVIVSGVPPFIPNEAVAAELRRFGKFASGLKPVSLGCKDPRLRHVQSLRRQVLMFLDSPAQTLEVSFRVKHGDGWYMLYASSGQIRCFECGQVGHKRFACPHRQQAGAAAAAAAPAAGAATAASEPAEDGPEGGPEPAGDGPEGGPKPAGDGPEGGPEPAGDGPDSQLGNKGEEEQREKVKGKQEQREQAKEQEEQQKQREIRKEQQKQVKEQQGSVAAGSSSSQAGEPGSEPRAAEHMEEEAGTSLKELAVGPHEEPGPAGSRASNGDGMDSDSESASLSGSSSNISDIYPLEDILSFLDQTFGRSVEVSQYFSDTDKFVRSVSLYKRTVGFDQLDEKKRYRLKRHITCLGKGRLDEAKERRRRRIRY